MPCPCRINALHRSGNVVQPESWATCAQQIHPLPPISYLLPSTFYLLSPISYLLSPIFYLLSSISYLLSPIFYLLSSISYLLSPISYLLPPTSPPPSRPTAHHQLPHSQSGRRRWLPLRASAGSFQNLLRLPASAPPAPPSERR